MFEPPVCESCSQTSPLKKQPDSHHLSIYQAKKAHGDVVSGHRKKFVLAVGNSTTDLC